MQRNLIAFESKWLELLIVVALSATKPFTTLLYN